jgi:2-polyprenyl-3-methyl-5-hydroxy-6-metoxy-1,4-benzoquinol methylase
MSTPEKAAWDQVKGMLGHERMTLGRHWSFNLRNDPKRFAFVLSRYKLAARLACKGKRVLELGCSEGLGAAILGEHAASYTGVDLDGEAIEVAKRNFPQHSFVHDSFIHDSSTPEGARYGEFDVVVSMDVIEHIEPPREPLFFDAVLRNLQPDGMAVIGTPNITSAPYASAMSNAGHVNLFSADRLDAAMRQRFTWVFPFGMNDEVAHTGYAPMCHFLISLGCRKRDGVASRGR